MDRQLLILRTDRLILRRLQASDISPLIDLWTDPVATEHLGGPRESTKLQTIFEEDLEDPFAYEYDLWPVIEKETNQVVGHCGLLEKEINGVEEIELNYIFLPSAWGNGFATEIGKALLEYGFTEKQLTRIIALIKPENQTSEKVARKLGMRFEKEIIRPSEEIRKVFVIEDNK